MNIIFSEEVNIDFSFDYKKICEDTVKAALDTLSFPYECEISVTITDDSGIQEMNKEFRGIDSPTDVLSFPLIQFDLAIPYDCLCVNSDDVNPDTDEIMLGDIVLNIDRIKKQAEEYGHSVEREYSFLICHSMLHLLGYDHIEEDDRLIMEDKQREIMERLGIKR